MQTVLEFLHLLSSVSRRLLSAPPSGTQEPKFASIPNPQTRLLCQIQDLTRNCTWSQNNFSVLSFVEMLCFHQNFKFFGKLAVFNIKVTFDIKVTFSEKLKL